jgi:hypothetical protein
MAATLTGTRDQTLGVSAPSVRSHEARVRTRGAALTALSAVLLAAACGTQPTPIGRPPISCVGLPATEPDVCGRIVARVQATHPDETRAASRILVTDTCSPRLSCERDFLYDTVVLLVPAGGEPPGDALHAYGHQGEAQEVRVEAWTGPLPQHVTSLLEQGWAAGWTPPPLLPR